jgi:hypothetical protein
MFSQTKQEEPRKTCTQVSACVGFFYHTKKYDWPAEGLIITDMQGCIWPDLSGGGGRGFPEGMHHDHYGKFSPENI